MRTRMTSLVSSVAVVCGALCAPAAQAADTSVRESAHGQWLCTVEPSASDRALARDVRESYIDTVRATSQQVQAQFPKLDFSGFTSRDVRKVPGYTATVAALSKAGYTGADMLIILVGATAPEALVRDEDVLVPEGREYSLNAVLQRAEDGPAPLLSSGTQFSPQLRQALRDNEDPTAVNAFNAAQAGAFEQCAQDLRAHGAKEGIQPVPELTIPGQTTQERGSSTGAAVLGGMLALAVVVVGGYMVMNGQAIAPFGGFEVPVLQIPGLG